jgi:TolB-like protein/tetratricopeptide (TPR) repeat protein
VGTATIAFAPFQNLSSDPAQDYFARGFVEDVATELSRFGTVEVLHPSAVGVAALTGRGGGGLEVHLPAHHIVHGSVRRAGDAVRVNVQLVEAANGRQLWADRYEATAADLLAVQDAIAARIARTLAVQVDDARLSQARRAPLASLDVYDCWLRGLECIRRGTVEADAEARRYFERALEMDPTYARAFAGLSLSHFNEWSCQAWERWDEKERLAHEYAARAVALDRTDAMVQVVLGRILVYRRRYEEAAYHVERALLLNPNDTDVLVHAGLCQAYLGDPEAALSTAKKAMRLNPAYPPWYAAPAGLALFTLGRDRECLELGVATLTKAFVDVAAFGAAAAALIGDWSGAQHYLQRFLEDFQERIGFGRAPEPGEPLRWLLHVNPFKRPEDRERLARGLALAGLEPDPDEGRAEARVQPTAADTAAATFHREGQVWTMSFGGLGVRLTHQKGFLDLAQLLTRPGTEVHSLELADRPAETGGDVPVLDDRARRELKARVLDLQQEIDKAGSAHDIGRAERAREELDQIVEHLSGALGLGGRSRQLGSATERARSAVTWRIRNAIRKIASSHPRLGRHLENSVRTGTFCVYEPETPTAWTL